MPRPIVVALSFLEVGEDIADVLAVTVASTVFVIVADPVPDAERVYGVGSATIALKVVSRLSSTYPKGREKVFVQLDGSYATHPYTVLSRTFTHVTVCRRSIMYTVLRTATT